MKDFHTVFKEANLCLAPMAGYTSAPFRAICFEEGIDFAYTEMVSADGLVRGGAKTFELMKTLPREGPVGIQLFGSDADILAEAAQIAQREGPAFIDVNCGCPVRKVVKRNGGVALMRDPERLFKIASKVVSSVDVPVLAKIRSGWSRREENFIEAGLALQSAGVLAVAIHPRYRDQGFTGKANWEHIARLREALKIEVIANGDVQSVDDFFALRNLTGVRIVMIGRGALGRPWIFRMIKEAISGKRLDDISHRERIEYLRKHYQLEVEWKGEKRGTLEMRKQWRWYLRGIPGIKDYRARLSTTQTASQVFQILEQLEEELDKLWKSQS